MNHVHGIQYKNNSKEELFPDFGPDFPYTCSYVEYDTPGEKIVFPEGSGGMVNSNILHSTKSLDPKKDTIQLDHIFDSLLISGQHGSLLDQKYILPFTGSPQAEILSFYPGLF